MIYRTVQPQGGTSQTLSITSSVGPVEIVIPPSVWNPARSRLNFTLSIPVQGAAKFNWLQANTLTYISRIVFYDSATNAVLLDCGNFDKYAAMVVPASTHIDSFLTKAASSAQVNGVIADATNNPVEDMVKVGTLGNNYTDVAAIDLLPQGGQLQRRQVFISTQNGEQNANVSIPFEAFKHTFLSLNKNVYFPSNTVMQIYFNAANQFVHLSEAVANAGTTPTALANANPPTLSNINISLANEANLTIVGQIIDKVMKQGGMVLPFAYPTTVRNVSPANATSHNYSLQLTRGFGNRILCLITSGFTTQNLNTNVHRRASDATTNLITQYQTFLNNVPIYSNAPTDCTRGQDFTIFNKHYLEKSVVQTYGEYILAEWLHVDGFCGAKPLWKYDEDQTMIDGLDVGAQSSTWSIQATTTAANTYSWITAIIGQKTLTITSGGAMVV